jgi:hypothetical protein
MIKPRFIRSFTRIWKTSGAVGLSGVLVVYASYGKNLRPLLAIYQRLFRINCLIHYL